MFERKKGERVDEEGMVDPRRSKEGELRKTNASRRGELVEYLNEWKAVKLIEGDV